VTDTEQTSRDSQGANEAEAWLDGFRWPVPTAFSGAVSAHRFEQGDVLYRSRRAYETLEGEAAFDADRGLAIQVLEPARGLRSTSAIEGEGDRRRSSWQAEVVVELHDLSADTRDVRRMTQGRLYTALWHGDARWLEADAEDPPVPRGARELQARLEQSRAAFARALGALGGARFLFVVDLANEASRAKARSVEESLRADGPVERLDLRPERAGIEAPDAFSPTLVVRGLVAPDRDVDRVQALLRRCLYAGASGRLEPSAEDARRDEAAAGGDRFSVARHGLLEPNEP